MRGISVFLFIGLMFLSACGFQPLYGERANGSTLAPALDTVAVDTIADATGQALRNELIDQLYHQGAPKKPAYRLAISLQRSTRNTGIKKDAAATRAELYTTANISLIDSKSGEVIWRDKAVSRVAYNILEAPYGTLVARENAESRALEDLSRDIITRLSLYFERRTTQ